MEHMGDRKAPCLGCQTWWTSLLAMRSVDKKRTFKSERAQNVVLSNLFFSFCFPVCVGAFIFAREPGFPGASLLATSSKGSWRGA